MTGNSWRTGDVIGDTGPFGRGTGRLLRRFRYSALTPEDCRAVAHHTARLAGCAALRGHWEDRDPEQLTRSGRRRVLLESVEELHRDRYLGDARWAALDLDAAQRVELCFLVGHIDLIAMLCNSFDRTLDDTATVTPLRTGRSLDAPGWLLPDAPRLPPPGRSDIGVRTWLFSKGVGLLNGGGAVDGVEMFSRSPELFWSVAPFLVSLGPLRLGRELGELITLRATWNVGSEYHWGHHGRAARFIGLSESDIARIPDGPSAAGWSDTEILALTAVDELHERRSLSDTTWKSLTAAFDTRQIAEICLLTGNYEMLCMALNSFGIRFEPDAWQGGAAAPLWSALAHRGARRAAARTARPHPEPIRRHR
ncbi:carboxymuconolactone decarboxylase family protein [Nocardia sp. NPDC127526]|uniref:carboxymuconolactone decarboxylase family protein n=1 Tax=Nocardia sp. NPDC127526 TaxID=3345393 RepID=UPI00362B0115